jgi:hypothetical protein
LVWRLPSDHTNPSRIHTSPYHRMVTLCPGFHFPCLRPLRYTAMIAITYHGNGTSGRTRGWGSDGG